MNGLEALLAPVSQQALNFGDDNRPRRTCETCIGPTYFRPICNPCENYSAWEPLMTTEATVERLLELALEIATAKGVRENLRAAHKPYENAEQGYQDAVKTFDAALRAAMIPGAK